MWFFWTYTGKLAVPDSFLPAVILTFLSVTTYSISTSFSTTVSCIRTQLRTTAPFLTLTPRNSTQFSTVPSMVQPSASRELDTLLPVT